MSNTRKPSNHTRTTYDLAISSRAFIIYLKGDVAKHIDPNIELALHHYDRVLRLGAHKQQVNCKKVLLNYCKTATRQNLKKILIFLIESNKKTLPQLKKVSPSEDDVDKILSAVHLLQTKAVPKKDDAQKIISLLNLLHKKNGLKQCLAATEPFLVTRIPPLLPNNSAPAKVDNKENNNAKDNKQHAVRRCATTSWREVLAEDIQEQKENLMKQALNQKREQNVSPQIEKELKEIADLKLVTRRVGAFDQKNPIGLFKGGRAAFESALIKAEAEKLFKAADAPVTMHYWSVAQDATNGWGEFKFPNRKETDDELVDREFNHIEKVIETPYQEHLAKHCTVLGNPNDATAPYLYELRDDKKNDVTCVMFQEGHFYSKRPLSERCFTVLMGKIKKSIEKKVGNFHLALGTFPVIDQNKNVFNVLAYVQSGNPATITLSNKAWNYPLDPYYRDTRAPNFKIGSENKGLSNELQIQGKALCQEWLLKDYKNLKPKTVIEFIQLCLSNADYPPPEELKAELNLLLQHIRNHSLDALSARQFAWKIAHVLGLEDVAPDLTQKIHSNNTIVRRGKTSWNTTSYDVGAMLHFLNYYSLYTTHLEKKLIAEAQQDDDFVSEEEKNEFEKTAARIKRIVAQEEKFVARIKNGNNPEDLVDFFNYHRYEVWLNQLPVHHILSRVTDDIQANRVPGANDLSILHRIRNKKRNLFYNPTYGFLKQLRDQAASHAVEQLTAIRNNQFDTLDQPVASLGPHASRHVPCETAGGAKFSVSLDICADHQSSIGKKSKLKKVTTLFAEGKSMMPAALSHIVVSNSVSPMKENSVAKEIAQADPYCSGMLKSLDQDVIVSQDIYFGGPFILKSYAPVILSEGVNEIQEIIDLNNKFMRDYFELTVFQARYPLLHEAANRCILLHLFQCCIKPLNQYDPFLHPAVNLLKNHLLSACDLLQQHHRPSDNQLDEIEQDLQALLGNPDKKLDSLAQFMQKHLHTERRNTNSPILPPEQARDSRQLQLRWRT